MTRPRACAYAIALIAFGSVAAYAQEPATDTPRPPSITTTIDADVLADLPSDGTAFSVLETAEPSLISDRISGGGLYTGQAPRIGGFLSSWSQTLFRLGDVNLSDPTGSGAPLLLPDIQLWSSVRITTGMMAADTNAAGVAVSLEPRLPTPAWSTTLGAEGGPLSSGNADILQRGPSSPVASLEAWDRAAATSSGPLLTDAQGQVRLAGFFGASWTRGKAAFADRGSPTAATAGSAFAHLVFTPGEGNELRTIGWVQKNTAPFDDGAPGSGATTRDDAAHVQATWEHGGAAARRFHVFAAYTQRARTLPAIAADTVFERLTDGPVSRIAFESPDTVRQWSIGARLPSARAGVQTLDGGIEIGGSRDRSSSFFHGTAGELVDGIPARVWAFNAPAAAVSQRHATTISGYISDRVTLARLVVEGAVRYDGVDASAEGAVNGVRWQTWLPRARVAWTVADAWRPTLFAGVSRSAYRLPLDLLAIGDPGAPTASVYQWLPAATGAPSVTATGAMIANVGPGSGGSASFSRIDPDLKRPTTDELTVGIEAHPSDVLTLRGVGFLRRERHLLALTDPGTLATAFALSGVPDPGLQLENPIDDQLLPVYSRNTSSFGQDRYLLTNPDEPAATSESLEISATLTTPHVTLFGGASANMSNGTAAAVGFGPLENDQDVVGDMYVDPNAATFDRGRVFTDRAYTIKLASVLRLPQDVRVGILARYQDGQPFSRLVVASGLNQGAEAIRAFPNGESRFTFTETLDLRVQKGFRVGRERVAVVLDVFNLLDTKNEVEERTVTGATFRAVTAIQPPRAVHAGFNVTF